MLRCLASKQRGTHGDWLRWKRFCAAVGWACNNKQLQARAWFVRDVVVTGWVDVGAGGSICTSPFMIQRFLKGREGGEGTSVCLCRQITAGRDLLLADGGAAPRLSCD